MCYSSMQQLHAVDPDAQLNSRPQRICHVMEDDIGREISVRELECDFPNVSIICSEDRSTVSVLIGPESLDSSTAPDYVVKEVELAEELFDSMFSI